MSYPRRMLSLTAAALVAQFGSIASVAAQQATDAAAAPAAEEKKAVVEEITVTGSRVKRKDLNTPAPVSVINKEAMITSGKVSLGEYLQSMPEQGNAVNAQVNNGNDGTIQVDLRSIGAQRTLVLVNGRRTVGEGGVDLNSIPAAAVERIEVLKDGASAVYGSDAVAGVVNIILKRRMNGTEAAAYAGVSSRGDGSVYEINATTGTGSEKGNILFSLGYQQSGSLMAKDRDFASSTVDYSFQTGNRIPGGGNSSTFPAGRFSLPASACTAAMLDPATVPADILAKRESACAARADGLDRFGSSNIVPQYSPTGATTYNAYTFNLYNTNPTNYILTPARRIQLFSAGDANLGNWGRAYYEASYVNRYAAYTLAPMPLVNNTVPTNVVVVSADNIYNPFGVNITSWRHRTTEFGDRYWKVNGDTMRAVVGADGTLGDWAGPLQGWAWDVNYNGSQLAQQTQDSGQMSMSRVANAVGPSMIDPATGNPVCVRVAGQISTRINGCVPMNVLGGEGAIDPASKAYVAFSGVDRFTNNLQMGSASLSGELFRLMSDRPVGLALGVERRTEGLTYQPDPVTVALDSSGNNQLPTSGSFNVTEGYGELLVPILSNQEFVEDLELQLAARTFKYNLFGSDSTYKIGGKYTPVRDATIRATYSTAFRAPNSNDLFAGETDSYPSVRDPCFGDLNTKSATTRDQCLAQGVPVTGSADPSTQLLEKWQSNRNLQPEKAKTFTVGVVLQPRWVPNLSVTLDYYNVQVDDAISRWGAGVILSRCYNDGVPEMCALVRRNDTGQVQYIADPKGNLTKFDTAGLDFSVQYQLPTTSFGRFTARVDGNYLIHHKYTDSAGFVYSNKGNYDFGVLPSLKANLLVGWRYGDVGVGAMLRYVGSIKECGSGACSVDATDARDIGAYLPLNLFANYEVKSAAGTTRLLAGIQNVFDVQPPLFYNAAAANSDPYTYDYIGRYFYFRVAQSF